MPQPAFGAGLDVASEHPAGRRRVVDRHRIVGQAGGLDFEPAPVESGNRHALRHVPAIIRCTAEARSIALQVVVQGPPANGPTLP